MDSLYSFGNIDDMGFMRLTLDSEKGLREREREREREKKKRE